MVEDAGGSDVRSLVVAGGPGDHGADGFGFGFGVEVGEVDEVGVVLDGVSVGSGYLPHQ